MMIEPVAILGATKVIDKNFIFFLHQWDIKIFLVGLPQHEDKLLEGNWVEKCLQSHHSTAPILVLLYCNLVQIVMECLQFVFLLADINSQKSKAGEEWKQTGFATARQVLAKTILQTRPVKQITALQFMLEIK